MVPKHVSNRRAVSSRLQCFTSSVFGIKSSFALQEAAVVEAEPVVEIQVNHTENLVTFELSEFEWEKH